MFVGVSFYLVPTIAVTVLAHFTVAAALCYGLTRGLSYHRFFKLTTFFVKFPYYFCIGWDTDKVNIFVADTFQKLGIILRRWS